MIVSFLAGAAGGVASVVALSIGSLILAWFLDNRR